MRRVWIIEPDPIYAEYIRAPIHQVILNDFRGDCDDAAVLAAALLHALGWPCRFVAIRLPGSFEFSHVWTQAEMPESYFDGDSSFFSIDIDPIVPQESLPIRTYAEKMEVEV